ESISGSELVKCFVAATPPHQTHYVSLSFANADPQIASRVFKHAVHPFPWQPVQVRVKHRPGTRQIFQVAGGREPIEPPFGQQPPLSSVVEKTKRGSPQSVGVVNIRMNRLECFLAKLADQPPWANDI